MAKITTTDTTSIYQLTKWLGLNESPDGDTGLKMGEAAVMRNFRVTREGHLQIRPGYSQLCELAAGSPVRGLWSGYVGGKHKLLAACAGQLWAIDLDTKAATAWGALDDSEAFFFGFSQKVYILTGSEYYCWDGETDVQAVVGHVPIVATAVPPTGGGTLLERVNLLTGNRKAKFSPDGSAAAFQLPETEVDEVLEVEGTDLTWEADTEAGTVTFSGVPAKGVNTITITWRKGEGQREKVTAMRFAELYNGASDTRVFLYGDGTNEAIYSDLDSEGMPNAEYFPELNLMAVDSANTPITAMVRHYDRLLVFKPDSSFNCQYSTVTLETGEVTAAFYCTPLNREIGCAAPGQARLVRNDARTIFGQAVYKWSLTVNGTRDERNAERISERVENTLASFDATRCKAFDDERRQEYYVLCDDQALVHNYGNDTWYYYDHFPVRCMEETDGGLHFGTADGRIMHLSKTYHNDDLQPIDAYWESGSMDFEQNWKRKYSANIWIGIKPESGGRITVTAQSNKKSEYVRKTVAASLASLVNVDFAHFSFNTNRKPQVQRVRLKVKKFTFYKLILESCSASSAATVLAVDFQIRYTGNVK